MTALDGQAGFVPPRYTRAERTTDALLRAGRELLSERALDSVTIQEICTAACVTTGAFYGRFDSKGAFFGALQAVTRKDSGDAMRARLAALKEGEWTLEAAIHALLAELRRLVLRHQGVLRASIFEAHGTTWSRIQEGRYAFIEEAVPVLLRLHKRADPVVADRRIRIAFQFAIGSIINAMLNNPGPLRLASREFDEELVRAFCAYVNA
ncbi:helix-turn-helix domain-containing protein [Cupriavidus metallidurans]|uniref:TetR/AcrR family transcriptional regulator n=1 Tax=Cupriavidus TaxID=106589 RepID=UPI001650CD60|nr:MULTISPECIES: TetR/AcrR family transcriptional regulator [Cupriavidus]